MELFNLRTDTSERKNLFDEFPEKANQLKSLLENWWKETKAPIPIKLNPEYVLDK